MHHRVIGKKQGRAKRSSVAGLRTDEGVDEVAQALFLSQSELALATRSSGLRPRQG